MKESWKTVEISRGGKHCKTNQICCLPIYYHQFTNWIANLPIPFAFLKNAFGSRRQMNYFACFIKLDVFNIF